MKESEEACGRSPSHPVSGLRRWRAAEAPVSSPALVCCSCCLAATRLHSCLGNFPFEVAGALTHRSSCRCWLQWQPKAEAAATCGARPRLEAAAT